MSNKQREDWKEIGQLVLQIGVAYKTGDNSILNLLSRAESLISDALGNIPLFDDSTEIIDGREMSEQDIQAVEDKYPGIFTTPGIEINMEAVPHNNPIVFSNLDFTTSSVLPVANLRQSLSMR